MNCKSCTAHKIFTARCSGCRAQAAKYENRRRLDHIEGRRRLVPSAPSAQLLRGLMALGWTGTEIGRRAGRPSGKPIHVGRIMLQPTVTADTARRIERVARDLAGFPGPSRLTAKRAEAAGWEPLELGDLFDCDDGIDEIAVEKAVSGDQSVGLNRLEVMEAGRRLLAAGNSKRGVARVLGVNERLVLRWFNEGVLPYGRKAI